MGKCELKVNSENVAMSLWACKGCRTDITARKHCKNVSREIAIVELENQRVVWVGKFILRRMRGLGQGEVTRQQLESLS